MKKDVFNGFLILVAVCVVAVIVDAVVVVLNWLSRRRDTVRRRRGSKK